jgi:hypothetical protein
MKLTLARYLVDLRRYYPMAACTQGTTFWKFLNALLQEEMHASFFTTKSCYLKHKNCTKGHRASRWQTENQMLLRKAAALKFVTAALGLLILAVLFSSSSRGCEVARGYLRQWWTTMNRWCLPAAVLPQFTTLWTFSSTRVNPTSI